MKKKKLKIILPIIGLTVVGAGGFCTYWFLMRKSNDEVSINYALSYESISCVNTNYNSTVLSVEYAGGGGIKWNDIHWTEYSNLPDTYSWDQILKIEGLHGNDDDGTHSLTISFRDDVIFPTDVLQFKFWLVASVHKQEFKSPEIICYLAQRDIGQLPKKDIGSFYDGKPTELDVVKTFFAMNELSPNDWDLHSWNEVLQQLTVNFNDFGAMINVNLGNSFFSGQAQVTFEYPKGVDINTIIVNKNLGTFIKQPNRQDIRLRVELLNTTTTPLSGWEAFWSQVVTSEPNHGVCYIEAFGDNYFGSIIVSYEVV
ncbi:MAG: hypothetical protein LBF36_03765 [Mycoplasmataceae bacterium]|nr:hypothetical protein [Mycoplasmataceae bacterium]